MAAGRKTGGRQKGTPNKRTLKLQALAAPVQGGDSPLEFLTGIYRNTALPLELRVDAAAKAAPLVHPRLGGSTLKGDGENPLQVINRIEMVPVEPPPCAPEPDLPMGLSVDHSPVERSSHFRSGE